MIRRNLNKLFKQFIYFSIIIYKYTIIILLPTGNFPNHMIHVMFVYLCCSAIIMTYCTTFIDYIFFKL